VTLLSGFAALLHKKNMKYSNYFAKQQRKESSTATLNRLQNHSAIEAVPMHIDLAIILH